MHLQSRGKSFPKINVKKPLLRQDVLIWFKVGSMRSGLLWDFSEAKRYYTDGLQTDPDPQLEWLGEGFPNSMNLLQYSPSWRSYHVCCFLLQHNICKWIICNCVVLFRFFFHRALSGRHGKFIWLLSLFLRQPKCTWVLQWVVTLIKLQESRGFQVALANMHHRLLWQLTKGEKNIKITLTIFKTHFIAFQHMLICRCFVV